ncbi:MAG: beta-galactosidase [Bacteroidia bacterium]
MITKKNFLTLTVLPLFLLVNSISCTAQKNHSGGKKNKKEIAVADVGQDDLSALTSAVSGPFKGIYASSGWNKPVDDYVLKSPSVDGVFLRLHWNLLEPADNKYDWAFLDSELKRISDAGKKITIGVAAGSHTPEWVYGAGVPSASFEEFRKQGNGKKFNVKVPVPWNQKFLDIWTGFIKDFADHLKSKPGIYQNITLVKLTGINETTIEVRLPAQKGIENEKGASTDAPGIWRNAGYRPQKIRDAWDRITDAFQQNFSDKYVSIAVIPKKAFPALDDNGNEVPKNVARDFTEDLIEKAQAKFKDKLVVQWNSLQMDAGIPKLMAWCTKFHIPFGYQLEEADMGEPSCLKTPPCDQQHLKAIFDKGIKANASFIEIFPKEVIAYPEALAYGHAKLMK